jgi:glycosyltransferase involved in cell wall biosynthesis
VKVLIIPEIDMPPTSERTPEIYRRLMRRHEVVGLRPRWDNIIYDVDRPAILRVPPYILDKIDLIVRGLKIARREKPDAIFCETYHHALVGVAIGKLLGIPCIWDSHGNVLLFAQSAGKGRLFTLAAGTIERLLGRTVSALVTVSEVDANAYVRMGVPREKILVFPSCVDVEDIDRRVRERRRKKLAAPRVEGEAPIILFFGSFKYGPNRDALQFVNEVLAPALARSGTRFRIQVAGRDIPDMTFHPSIEILGFVPDIYPCIADADVAIVPLWKGVGILVKALDVMAVGTPVVAADFLAKGIPQLQDGVHALLADTPERFIELVREVALNPIPWQPMAARGKELVIQYYDWAHCWVNLEAVLFRVQKGRANGAKASGTSTP